MKALVTGACGFAGSHLVELLFKVQGGLVDGTHRPAHEPVPHVLEGKLRPHALDIEDAESCRRVLAEVAPTHLFHLAGPAEVGSSFARAAEVSTTIYGGAVKVFEAAAQLAKPPRTVLVSSAEVYGESGKDGTPLSETTPVLPDSPYAVSKLAAETYGGFLTRANRLPVIVSRSFNHLGPRQSEHFAAASFARQIALAEVGKAPPEIRTGNLSAARDFLDVRDVVRAYVLLAERGTPGEIYNVASGTAVGIGELLEKLVRRSRIPLTVTADPTRQRPADVPLRIGDAAKIRRLGWAPELTLERTLDDLMGSSRQAVRSAA